MIGVILGAVLAVWVAFLAIGGMVAMVKAFAVIGLTTWCAIGRRYVAGDLRCVAPGNVNGRTERS